LCRHRPLELPCAVHPPHTTQNVGELPGPGTSLAQDFNEFAFYGTGDARVPGFRRRTKRYAEPRSQRHISVAGFVKRRLPVRAVSARSAGRTGFRLRLAPEKHRHAPRRSNFITCCHSRQPPIYCGRVDSHLRGGHKSVGVPADLAKYAAARIGTATIANCRAAKGPHWPDSARWDVPVPRIANNISLGIVGQPRLAEYSQVGRLESRSRRNSRNLSWRGVWAKGVAARRGQIRPESVVTSGYFQGDVHVFSWLCAPPLPGCFENQFLRAHTIRSRRRISVGCGNRSCGPPGNRAPSCRCRTAITVPVEFRLVAFTRNIQVTDGRSDSNLETTKYCCGPRSTHVQTTPTLVISRIGFKCCRAPGSGVWCWSATQDVACKSTHPCGRLISSALPAFRCRPGRGSGHPCRTFTRVMAVASEMTICH